MKFNLITATGLIIAFTTSLHAQEVVIDSLDGNGQLTVTAPSNSDFTVEWASSFIPSSGWQNNWLNLKDIPCTNGTMTIDVPMFYRVTCWTNGLFLRMPAGRTFVYSVSNALGQVWTENFSMVAEASFPSMSNNYQLIIITQDWEGEMPVGANDEAESGFIRSTDSAMYLFDHFTGNEIRDWQNAPTGTTWTVDYGYGDSNTAEIVAIETVVVPAGTFPGCIKIHKYDHNEDIDWYEWVKPGFFMVKWVDHFNNESTASPAVYELHSWKDD
jgi:hypothetical protein